MALLNEYFLDLPTESRFSDVVKKINAFRIMRPNVRLTDMGINDADISLPPAVMEAMHRAVDDMSGRSTFSRSGSEQGYEFLRDAIIKNDFNPRGIHLIPNEIFINNGVKSEIGNIGDVLRGDNTIGVMDPIYPIYIENNVISGRAGIFEGGRWSNVSYMSCNEANGFTPMPPEYPIDIVYLCSPNNPCGAATARGS